MKHSKFILLTIFINNICYSQPSSIIRDDSLIVNCNRSFFLVKEKEKQKRIIDVKLDYDYKVQYPFYKIASKNIGFNNEITFSFIHIPSKGFLYIFTEDNMNNYFINKVIKCDSVFGKIKLSISFFPKKEKLEYINMWYSNFELNDFSNYLKSLQYSTGEFMKRTVYFLDEKLIFPNRYWNFKENTIGMVFENSIKSKEFILPLVIKFK